MADQKSDINLTKLDNLGSSLSKDNSGLGSNLEESVSKIKDAGIAKGPLGVDVGTSHIVIAQNKGSEIQYTNELNAFFTVPQSKVTLKTLKDNKVPFFEHENSLYILGFAAQNFANMFHADLRRPIENGIISPKEEEGVQVINSILNNMIPKASNFGETLCFGVPGEPLEGIGSVVYHEEIMKRYLGTFGYSPVSINEAMAVVMSELEDDSYTGLGISMGGGMCNICLSYLSVPVIAYSIQKGGDYINIKAAQSVGESATKLKQIKENDLDLSVVPKDRYLMALHIFYDDLINNLLNSLQTVINSSDKIPKLPKAIPMVFGGGTVAVKGFESRFNKLKKKYQIAIDISEIRVADDPLNTTAKGALKMALL